MYDRFFPTDIASFKIRELYDGISLAVKREAVGAFDTVNNEYVLTLPNSKVLKYNIITGEWVVKTIPLHFITEGVDQNLYGIGGNTHRFIVDYESGYSIIDAGDGTTDYYTATAKTKVMDGETAEGIIKSLMLGYCSYKTSNTLLINIYVDGVIADTITLDAQTVSMKPVEFHLGGVTAENIQLEFKLTTNASTEVGEIDFIKLFGNVHDIQGG